MLEGGIPQGEITGIMMMSRGTGMIRALPGGGRVVVRRTRRRSVDLSVIPHQVIATGCMMLCRM